MACEGFDLALALDDSLEVDSAFESDRSFESDSMEFDELDCSDPLNMSGRCDMHKGIKLEILSHPHSMRQVVNIIVALQRMKKPRSTEFSDHELLNIIMENVIEERHVNCIRESSQRRTYTKTKFFQCSLCDQFQKSLVRSSGGPGLLAVTLNKATSHHRVLFNLSTYASIPSVTTASQPVCLGISKSNLYLACTSIDGSETPALVLKEVSHSLDTINMEDEQYLFLRKETGVSDNTFESVKYPGWFISTSTDDYKPVEVSKTSANRFLNFRVNDQKSI